MGTDLWSCHLSAPVGRRIAIAYATEIPSRGETHRSPMNSSTAAASASSAEAAFLVILPSGSIVSTPRSAAAGVTPSPRARRQQRRRGQRVQPRVVLAADQVQGAAVEPGDQQRAVLGQSSVDVRGAQPGGAGANRQASTSRILSPHGEQARGDGDRIASRLTGETLGSETVGHGRSHRHSPIIANRQAAGGLRRRLPRPPR